MDDHHHHHQYIDLSGVRETSSSPEDSVYRDEPSYILAGEHTHSDDEQQQQPPTSPPTRRSTTGSPRYSLNNGELQQQQSYSNENSARPSYAAARRGSGGNQAVMATPGAVPVRRRDSLKHPFTLPLTQPTDGAPEDLATPSTSGNGRRSSTAAAAAGASSAEEGGMYRASPHGRRHSASVAVLHRDVSNSTTAPHNTTVSASPDHPATATAPTAATQEDVKRYVYTVMTDHATTLGTWERRVTVAEVYRDKPLRTGGIPAELRAQDRGFLERVEGSLQTHRQQLDDARSLLLQTRHAVPPTRHGGRGDVNAWDEYCSCYEQTLVDLAAEAKQMHMRVERLLKSEAREGSRRTHRTRAGSPSQTDSARASRARSPASAGAAYDGGRSSPQATPRGGGPSASARGSEARDTSSAAFDASPQPMDRYGSGSAATADRNPHVPVTGGGGGGGGGGAVQRGGSHAIRPGHGSESAARPSPAPERQQGSWTRASSLQPPPRHSLGSVASVASSRGQRQARALHPDTVVRQSVPTASPSDLQSPYGRLRSPKRAASPLRDPSHAVLVVPPPTDGTIAAAEQEGEAEKDEEAQGQGQGERPATARLSRASRATSLSARQAAVGLPPQLRTYSSPRGSARAAAPSNAPATPSVHPLRRRQLLEVIEHYEKHCATLQRGDLHRARECFYELYGEQQGLRQYCLWIDEIALSALRVSQTSA